jgi:secondary thiamine-phosphate synthase enzyme
MDRSLAFPHVVWVQRDVRLPPFERGFHLITREVEDALPELSSIGVGMAHVFIRHTSASLTINENASRDVLRDFAAWFDQAVPDGAPYFSHTLEGADDMPAHIKSSLLDFALTIPVSDGRFAFGTWQGIYLCEHRNSGGSRTLTVTAWGEERQPRS